MKWNHGHSWATGILTGIVISQHSVLLIIFGGVVGYLLSKLGAAFRVINRRLNRRWAIRP